ncbi:competence type IV pilus minor pilin ComGG [Streptococcus sinensis]|uniref:Late competence protein ComGG n=1 Tax=Streptococcus sinensis TaxID=176090 RepID=A0A0A0DDM9_9STRE|nr:competence type IV pilus minor pilin ComGG [Streptococcus sinensis]KGM36786.1 Late competence protein ComGG [Streptococcus sinensis]
MCKIKVKAGILLYALFMAAVFSLLLQFYLNRQVTNQRLFQANRERTEAHALAVLTKDTVTDDSGQLAFDQGSTHYRQQGKMLEVSSQLANQKSYSFYFENKKEAETKTKNAKENEEHSFSIDKNRK